jgi:hypothetical protein
MSERLQRAYSDLLLRLKADPLAADPAPLKPKRLRKRKPSLVSVAKQAAKAGLEVARYEVDPDGKIIVVTGKPNDMMTNTETGNEWDRLQ